jgi:glycosyltransferase involved in cell wall biosynthesis
MRVYMMDMLCVVPYYTASLCESLRREGCQVELGSITYYLDPESFRRRGLVEGRGMLNLAARAAAGNRMLRRPLKLSEYLLNLAVLSVRFMLSKPDVLHVQFLPLIERGVPLERWLLRLAKALGIRIVYTVHNVLPQDTGERHKSAFQRVYDLADAIICHDAEASRRLISEFGIPGGHIHVIPHGPLFHEGHPSSPAACRSELGFGPDQCVVLCQGFIRPYKGIPFLLASWWKVQDTVPGARLVIAGCGDTEHVAEVEKVVQDLGLHASVRRIFDFLPSAELMRLYTAADILIYPYKEITSSGALMTGVGFHKPIIATALPAFRRILSHEQTALLIEYGATDALAAAIARLAADAGLRARLAEGAANIAVSSWTKIAKQTYQCYESICPARHSLRKPVVVRQD